eukprot:COSAG03_NODE_111_length_12507_cov_28.124355_9_plen_221_part_00
MHAGRGNISERRQIVSHYTSRNFSTRLHPLVDSQLAAAEDSRIRSAVMAPRAHWLPCSFRTSSHPLRTRSTVQCTGIQYIYSIDKQRQNACGGARALARMCGACEMLRRRGNLNRTFRKCETGHFTFRIFRRFETGHFAFRICETGHFAFRRCETGHFAFRSPDTPPPDTLGECLAAFRLHSARARRPAFACVWGFFDCTLSGHCAIDSGVCDRSILGRS